MNYGIRTQRALAMGTEAVSSREVSIYKTTRFHCLPRRLICECLFVPFVFKYIVTNNPSRPPVLVQSLTFPLACGLVLGTRFQNLALCDQAYFIDGLVLCSLNPQYLNILAVRAYAPIPRELLVW